MTDTMSHDAPPAPPLPIGFVGTRGALFKLAAVTGFWTILTAGFYRFWMKTRLRRWYWSAIRPGGHPMEYVGDPWEKLLGFFIAVVILTFYIGIVNLLLMFVSFSVFSSAMLGYAASFLGLVPLFFYAQYRSRRYVLGRTRWRGVRFGLEPGAWGYAWRAVVHWLITICTLGLLWPRMTFWLEKYKTDRTFFGSAKLRQEGRWTMLYRAAIPFALSLLGGLLLVGWLVILQPLFPDMTANPLDGVSSKLETVLEGGSADFGWIQPWRLALFLPVGMGLMYGVFHYRFATKRILANHKTADGMTMRSSLRGPRVVGIYLWGTFVAYMVLVVGLILLVFLAVSIFGATMVATPDGFDWAGGLPRWIGVTLLAAFYLVIFLGWGVLYHVFVTYPLMAHMATTLVLPRADGLPQVSQRERDAFAEAEGFAEALDLGAAI